MVIFYSKGGANFVQNEEYAQSELAKSYNAAGIVAMQTGNIRAADSLFQLSITAWQKVTTYDVYRSYPYYQLAVLYSRLGDFDKSFAFYRHTVDILQKAPDNQLYILAGVYNSIGSFYNSLGDIEKSSEYYLQARKLAELNKQHWITVYSNAQYGLARNFYDRRQYEKVIQFSQICLDEGVARERDFIQIIANSHIFLGAYDQGISLLKELGAYYHKNNELEYLYNLLFLARAYTLAGDSKLAELQFGMVHPLLSRLKATKDPWWIFYYELYGQMLLLKAAQTRSNELQLDLYTKALAAFDQALLLNSRNTDNKLPYLETSGDVINPTQVKDVFSFRTKTLKLIAKAYEQKGTWLIARDFYHQALQSAKATTNFLHDFRISFIEEESKIILGENEGDVYAEGLVLSEFLYRETGLVQYFESMLYFIEAGKSAVFLASLNNIKAKNFGGIPDSLIQQERNIHLQLNSLKQARYDQQIAAKPDAHVLEELDKSIFRLQNKQETLNFLFESDYPEYYKFKYRNRLINAKEITAGLASNQALITYHIDEPIAPGDTGHIYALVFKRSGADYVKTPVSYTFIEEIQTVMQELTNVNIAETKLQNYIRLTSGAHYLYEQLIEPLPVGDKIRELIIVPDGKLSYFPFDILISELPDQQKINYRIPKYLIYRYNISYSYSATLHFEYFQKNRRKGHHILAFAPEYGETEVNINDAAYRRNGHATRTRLRSLPGAMDEVMGLSAYQGCEVFMGTAATETRFKENADNFDILHLAMHTIVNDSLPMFSKLVFSEQTDSIDDGFLNTQEIYNMKLDARLSVLSACNTGTGVLRGGEGVMSLSRAFLYAGCPAIVMTLWEVEDKVSAEIMLRFYNYLFKGYTKSEALQKAKLDHINRADPLKAHPYFWQGYIMVGDPSPIKFSNNVLFGILAFVGVMIFLAQFLGRKFLRHKKNSAS